MKNPYYNGFIDRDDELAQDYLNYLMKVYDQFINRKLYVRFHDGDFKGSVARVVPSGEVGIPTIVTGRVWVHHNQQSGYRFGNEYFSGHCIWDGRKNKRKITLPNRDVEILLDYDGETIYQKFDSKTAKETLLIKTQVHDIDGNVLQVGDPVLYMNLRYGAGGTLEHGIVQELKPYADSKNQAITVIVRNKDRDELSEIRYPDRMIYHLKKST